MLRIYEPCVLLRPYVRYYWVLESRDAFSVLTYPIGCTQMIFHRRQPFAIPELGVVQDRFTISGQVNFPAHVAADADVESVVVVFRPHAIKYFTGVSPEEFYNQEVCGADMESVELDALAARVLSCDSSARSVALVEEWLTGCLARAGWRGYERVGCALERLMSNPSTTVTALADVACLSRRQFERTFRAHVGMPPKEYARVVRFQKTLWMLQNGVRNYADVAYASGYSDQSHFIREFKEYSGLTPSQMLKCGGVYSDLFTEPR
ncbi:MAG: helix-turn-helix transcriptional regulator [Muribaculaceae bacterium]|nr:helix-turn-helix transcriptional regulator [Muribaculaceae bacterium]